MKLLKTVAAVAALTIAAVAPAAADGIRSRSTALPDGGTVVAVEYHTGGLFRHSTRTIMLYRCNPACELIGNPETTSGVGAAAYISPVAAAAALRPTRISNNETNVNNNDTSSASDNTNDLRMRSDTDVTSVNVSGSFSDADASSRSSSDADAFQAQGQAQGQLQLQGQDQGQAQSAHGGNGGNGGQGGNGNNR